MLSDKTNTTQAQQQPMTEEYLISAAIKSIIMEIGQEITSNSDATPKQLLVKLHKPTIDEELSHASPAMNALVNIITSGTITEFSNAPMNDFMMILASIESLTETPGFVTSCIKTHAYSHAKKLAPALNIL